MATMYKVTGHAAHATMNTPTGRVRQLFFKGQLLPPDTPQVEVDHLLSVKLIEPIQVGTPALAEPETPANVDNGSGADQGEGDTSPPGDTGTDPGGGDSGSAEPDADVEAKRAEARAKLPADGSVPDGRMGQPVFVEFLVTKGYDYAALAKEEKPALVELAKGLNA